MTTYITNDCLAAFMYQKLGMDYQSPLIGSLFGNDEHYLKFCKNFDKYIKLEPTFGKPNLPVKLLGVANQTIMFLGDIEIHWPHKNNDAYVLMRYKERLANLQKDVVFLWSDEQMFDGYSEKLRKEFEAIPGSRFMMVADIPNYRAGSLDYNKLGNYVLGVKGPEINFHG